MRVRLCCGRLHQGKILNVTSINKIDFFINEKGLLHNGGCGLVVITEVKQFISQL